MTTTRRTLMLSAAAALALPALHTARGQGPRDAPPRAPGE
jgi:hypothetical protein